MRHAPPTPPTPPVGALPVLLLCLTLVTAAPLAAAPEAGREGRRHHHLERAPGARIPQRRQPDELQLLRLHPPRDVQRRRRDHRRIRAVPVGQARPDRRLARGRGCGGRAPGAGQLLRDDAEIIADLDAKLAASLALVPDGRHRTGESRYGVRAANRIIALRANDGRNAAVTVPVGDRAGPLEPTPPEIALFTSAWMGGVTPSRSRRRGGSLQDHHRRSTRGRTSVSSTRSAITGARTWTRSGRKRRPRPPSSSRMRGSVRCRVPCATSRRGMLSTSTTAPGCSPPRTPPSQMARSPCGMPSSGTCGGGRSRPSATQMATATTGRPRSQAGRQGSERRRIRTGRVDCARWSARWPPRSSVSTAMARWT